jgi:ABC-type lipoprotein release transport system permease subunit
MSAMLYNTSATDIVSYAAAAVALATAALLASFIPAHRATRVDPLIALRAE